MTPPEEDVFTLINRLLQQGEAFCVATVVRTENATSAKAGAKAVVLGDGTIKGFLGGGCVQGAVRRAAREALEGAGPRLIRVKPTDEVVEQVDVDGVELHKSGCPSGGTADIFIEPMRQAPRLVICGASPVAIPLADLAQRLGYRVFAAALDDDLSKFGETDQRVEGFDLEDLQLQPSDYIVVATQGKRDREALNAALRSAAGYVAFVGSRRKTESMAHKLLEQGVSKERIDSLSAPAGLHIHAVEPAEIALSILSEIVAHRRRDVRKDNARSLQASSQ